MTKLSTKLPWHKRQRIHMFRVSGTVRKGSKTVIYRHHFLFRCSLFLFRFVLRPSRREGESSNVWMVTGFARVAREDWWTRWVQLHFQIFLSMMIWCSVSGVSKVRVPQYRCEGAWYWKLSVQSNYLINLNLKHKIQYLTMRRNKFDIWYWICNMGWEFIFAAENVFDPSAFY